jgi:hypothetical protein
MPGPVAVSLLLSASFTPTSLGKKLFVLVFDRLSDEGGARALLEGRYIRRSVILSHHSNLHSSASLLATGEALSYQGSAAKTCPVRRNGAVVMRRDDPSSAVCEVCCRDGYTSG